MQHKYTTTESILIYYLNQKLMSNLSKNVNTSLFTPSHFSFLFVIVFSILSSLNIQAQSGTFRTETQDQWGAVPKGNNAAAYMHRKFAAAFPNGLVVGCNNKLVLSNPVAITDFLPSSGIATILPLGTKVNPVEVLSNVLVGEIVALKLNIGFDEYDAQFSSNNILLKNMVVKTGVFVGKTVQQILQDAENAIGGCATQYLLSDLNDVVVKINQNFENKTTNMGFLEITNARITNVCLNDTEAPIFKEMPQTFTVFVEECYIASWNIPVITDNCSVVTLTSNINLGDCLPIGIHKVTMTAKDASGNKSMYSFTITIEEALYIAPLTGIKSNIDLITHSTKSDIHLNWLNKHNEKTSHFIVQKARIQGDFKDVDTLNASRLSGDQNYSYIDNKPKKNDNSYRIKTVMKDGTFEYSRTRTLDFNNKDVVQVYPSPNAEVVNVELLPYVDQNVKVLLYDFLGNPVFSQSLNQVTANPVKIDILDLPEGQYQLSMIPQNGNEITKMLFIRN